MPKVGKPRRGFPLRVEVAKTVVGAALRPKNSTVAPPSPAPSSEAAPRLSRTNSGNARLLRTIFGGKYSALSSGIAGFKFQALTPRAPPQRAWATRRWARLQLVERGHGAVVKTRRC